MSISSAVRPAVALAIAVPAVASVALVVARVQSEPRPESLASPGHAVESLQELGDRVFERAYRSADQVHVDVADADVRVIASSGADIEVMAYVRAEDLEWGREVFSRMELEVEERGSGLWVRADDPDVGRDEWRRGQGVGVTVVLRVPSETDLEVRTADGDVEVSAVRGMLRVHTSDGDVRVDAVDGSSVTLESSDGDILAGALRAERISIRTSDGDIRLGPVSGVLDARTSDGDVRVELGEVGTVDIRSSDGDIVILAPEGLRATLELEGEELSVARPFNLTGTVSDNRVRGDLNGGGPLVSIRSNDGSVSLRSSSGG